MKTKFYYNLGFFVVARAIGLTSYVLTKVIAEISEVRLQRGKKHEWLDKL